MLLPIRSSSSPFHACIHTRMVGRITLALNLLKADSWQFSSVLFERVNDFSDACPGASDDVSRIPDEVPGTTGEVFGTPGEIP